jgi:outer membrane protein assembly factor BamB
MGALLIVIALLVAGCGDVRQGVGWPSISLVQIGETTRIAVAHDHQVELVDPSLGRAVPLLDPEGNTILDDNGESRRWTIKGADYENATFFTNPIVSTSDSQTTLSFLTYTSRLLTFDAASAQVVDPAGVILTDGVIANVVQGDGLIYVPYRSGDLVALDAETYAEVWRLDTREGVWAAPVLHEGVLVVGSIDHLLYAVDAATGEAVWQNPVDLEGAIASSPLIAGDYLYIGSWSHKLFKVSLDGEIVATYEGANWIWSTPVISEGTLYYTDLSGSVYALDAETLTPLWVQKPATRGIRSAPVVTDEHVIVASRSGHLYWLSRETGSVIIDRELPGLPEVLSEMLIVPADEASGTTEPLLIVASVNVQHLLTAYTLDDGEQKWVYGR